MMTSALTWEELTRALLEQAREQEKRVSERLAYWTRLREVLETALALRAQEHLVAQNGKVDDSHAELRTLSVSDALRLLAKENGGFLVTRAAAKTLVRAGTFGSTKEARENIFTTLRRSTDFERERRGVYRLKKPGEIPRPPQPPIVVVPSLKPSLVGLVENILRDHPDWTRAQVRDYLIQRGWPFGTASPTFAVSAAFAALASRGRRKPRKARQTPLLPPPIPDQQPALAQ